MYAASFLESSISTSPSPPCPHASLISHYLWKPYQSIKTNLIAPIRNLVHILQGFLPLSLDLKHSLVTLGLQFTGTFNTWGPSPASKRKNSLLHRGQWRTPCLRKWQLLPDSLIKSFTKDDLMSLTLRIPGTSSSHGVSRLPLHLSLRWQLFSEHTAWHALKCSDCFSHFPFIHATANSWSLMGRYESLKV